MPSDTNLEIRIRASVDSSLAASTADVADRLNELVEQADKASSDIKTKLAQSTKANDATPQKKPDRSADDGARIEQQIAEKRIEGAQRLITALLSMGEESLDQFKAQAVKLEDDRYQIALEGAARRKSAGGKGGEGDESAKAELAEVEHQNRLSAIDVEYAEKKRAADRAATDDFIKSKESELNQALTSYAQQYQAGQISADQRHALETGLTASIEQEILNRLAADDAGLAKDNQAYEAAMKQREEIVQRFAARARTEDASLAREQAESWRAAEGKIDNAEGELVNDIFAKRQKLSRDLAQIGHKMVEQEGSEDLKSLTNQGLNSLFNTGAKAPNGGLLMSGISSLFGGGGSAASAGTQAAPSTATTANTAAITALTAALTGHGAVMAANTVSTGSHTIATGAQTLATGLNTGVTALDTTATTVNAASTDANTLATIGNTLAEWASAAADFITSLIPFDEGTSYVPRTMPALVHQGEMIIPAGQAATMRAGFNSSAIVASGGNSGGTASGDTHHYHVDYSPTFHGIDRQDIFKELKGHPEKIAGLMRDAVRSGHYRP